MSEGYAHFQKLVDSHCVPSARPLFSVHTSFGTGRGPPGKPAFAPYPAAYVDMAELSRDGGQVFSVKVTHHGSRRLAIRCHLEDLSCASLRYDGRPIVPGMSRTIEIEADGRFERSTREWCGLLRIEGTELLPGPMIAHATPLAGHAVVSVPVYARVSILSATRPSSSWGTPRDVPLHSRSCSFSKHAGRPAPM
jgi:hypothetical protein